LAIHFKRPAVAFGYNIIRQTQSQTCSLPSGLGGEKSLKDFIWVAVVIG
jgi:hypothetical protein